MKKQWLQAIVLGVVVSGLAVGAAEGQRQMTADMPEYDTGTEETIRGIVVSVTSETEWTERVRRARTSLRGTRASRLENVRMAGSHILLDTPDGDIEVHVAPNDFLTSNNFAIERHEEIEIVGSRITVNGEEMIVARELTQDGRTLAVRDSNGMPSW